ncbi:MFS transporter [Schumannella soli]|uniref:MFS transporter n=1 Tax=Schumannella soli TaxID=2590779 RepID=A0A506XY47_9MICO|nr:MFS transporter [Schumannella soli]TPW74695.1 MFS transporter [Schumannella soli]
MRFAALRAPWYRGYLIGGILLMSGDHVEHAITYFVMWQKFQSPVLAGFATISHWVPFLLGAIPFGHVADRFDNRRIIQASCVLFALVSVAWAVLIGTNTLQPWPCVILLVLHGLSGAFWNPADQLMLYDMVGPKDLPSGVRLMATGLNLGQLAGPALGAALLFIVGPVWGMALNVLLYVPFFVYLAITPVTGHRTRRVTPPRMRVRDVLGVLREVPRYPAILLMMLVQGAVGLFIGTALLPLLPDFGRLLGQDQGPGYILLLIAMSTGAVAGGLGMEALGRIAASTRVAIIASALFGLGVLVFALSRSFPLSVAALVLAGLGNLVGASTAQTVVQLAAPEDRRGAFIGAFGMAANGFRAGSGIVVGGLSALLGVASGVGIGAGALLVVALVLLTVVTLRRRRGDASVDPAGVVALD